MTAADIETILNTLTVNKRGHIRGKNKAIYAIMRLHLEEVYHYRESLADASGVIATHAAHSRRKFAFDPL